MSLAEELVLLPAEEIPVIEEPAAEEEAPSEEETAPAEEAEEPAADGAAESAGVPIDWENFPDEAFRSLVRGAYDQNGDGYLSPAEGEAVIALDCAGMGIEELSGIEYFTALEYLYCDYNNLTELDVSDLKALWGLDCSANDLRVLNVSGCEKLEELWVHGNDLTELDLTRNSVLEARIGECGLLEEGGTDVWTGRIGGVRVTPLKNDSGLRVRLSGGVLVNAGNFPDWNFRMFIRDGVDDDGAGYLTAAETAAVREIVCAGRNIADFTGIEYFPNLCRLDCRDNPLEELDLVGNPLLETVYQSGERIEGDGIWVYLHEESNGFLLIDTDVQVRTGSGIADVDRDGDTDMDDALLVLMHTVGTAALTGEAGETADVNGDGVIDARDATGILRYLSGKAC